MAPPTKLGFARSLLLPATMLFALPVLAAWFSGHAARKYDERFLEVVLPQVERDASLSAEERGQATRFYQSVPPSRACADESADLSSYRQNLGERCGDYSQFAWSRQVAWLTIAIGLGAMLVALVCSLAAFVSRPLQYASFLVGWNVLKVVGALEAILQGGLLVWLSFWMTAVWTERYFVKLIAIAGVAAALAAYNVVRAIFRKPPEGIDVEGERLSEDAAPALWARIRQLSEQLGTQPPDHIVAGIDDNFFVTEAAVRVGEETLRGRILYVSLSLLRTLQRSEADAVLAHEMAHLLGGDTGHSQKLAPLSARFVQYLEALHEGVVTRPIFHFMLAYFAVFQLALSRSHRMAEFAADAVAARATSAMDIARSLLKVGAYASYRQRVEEAVFDHDQPHAELGIAARVAGGFGAYARTEALHNDLGDAVTPHPFDSHPTLRDRIARLGVQLAPADYEPILITTVESSWTDTIRDAAAIESRLWAVYQGRFAAAHDLALAYRYQPANDEERAHVEKHFPALTFAGKSDADGVELDYEMVRHPGWEAPVRFEDIHGASVEERLFKKYLDLKLKGDGVFKQKRSICLTKLEASDELLASFNHYYGRHEVMTQHQAAKSD